MRVLDLFSGIGGFSLGLERAGMRTVAFCEIEPFCQAVLRKHWPNIPCYDDIKTLTAKRLAEDGISPIDLICGGFPCQPSSTAGKRLGAEDDRWLWPEYRRIIEDSRPAWVLGENVTGIISLELDNVLTDLACLGYSTATFNIPACAVGARHIRERIWIVAYAVPNGCKERVNVLETAADQAQRQHEGGKAYGIFTEKNVADVQCGKRSLEWEAGRVGRERQSIPRNGDWETSLEPCLGRKDDGIPQRLDRLRALGNAVVPQIPEIIGRAIMQAEREMRK